MNLLEGVLNDDGVAVSPLSSLFDSEANFRPMADQCLHETDRAEVASSSHERERGQDDATLDQEKDCKDGHFRKSTRNRTVVQRGVVIGSVGEGGIAQRRRRATSKSKSM